MPYFLSNWDTFLISIIRFALDLMVSLPTGGLAVLTIVIIIRIRFKVVLSARIGGCIAARVGNQA